MQSQGSLQLITAIGGITWRRLAYSLQIQGMINIAAWNIIQVRWFRVILYGYILKLLIHYMRFSRYSIQIDGVITASPGTNAETVGLPGASKSQLHWMFD